MKSKKAIEQPLFHWDPLIALTLVAITVTAYSGVWDCDFVNFDDHIYVTENPGVQEGLSLSGIKWAWTTLYAGYWQPMTWMSLQLDYQLHGLSPGGYHLTNLLLHVINVVLLFLILLRLTGERWPSALVAALFAIHPLHVESVAWVTERKDVLSTLFWLLALAAYLAYVRRPDLRRYLLVVLAFVLGLMAKPMVVTLPIILLLLDYWPLGRLLISRTRGAAPTQLSLRQAIVEKLPLFAVAVGFGILTVIAQGQAGAVVSKEDISVTTRLGAALLGYASYLGKVVWPHRLAVFYPHPLQSLGWGQVAFAGLLLIAISTLVAWNARRRPYLLVGWLWFVIVMFPVSGVLQSGDQLMADRFTYLPNIGLYLMLAWGLGDVVLRWPAAKNGVVVLASVALIACLILTRKQVNYWHDSVALWNHTIAVTDNNFRAHQNLGYALAKQGKPQEAVKQFNRVLEIRPGFPPAHFNLGVILLNHAKTPEELQEAARHFLAALQGDPTMAEAQNRLGLIAHGYLGVLFLQQGEIDKARTHALRAIELNPTFAQGYDTLARCALRQGKFAEAERQVAEVLRIYPKMAIARNLMGNVLARQGRWKEAISWHQDAARSTEKEPTKAAKYHADLAVALEKDGQSQKAQEAYQTASQLEPGWQKATQDEAWRLATHADPKQRDAAEALYLAEQVCLAASNPEARALDVLAAAQAEAGQFKEAVSTVRKAIDRAGSGDSDYSKELQERLNRYESGKPYYQPPK